MRYLTDISLDVFWKLMDKAWINGPEDHDNLGLEVRYIAQLATLDEAATLMILDMNFLDSIESTDAASVKFLLDLASHNMDELWSLLSSPELTALTESGQDEKIPLLYLSMQDPQSAAVIEALPWVQNGIHELEMWSVSHLVDLALRSQTVFHALLAKERNWLPPDPWIDVDSLKLLVSISASNEAAAVQILELPFLETIEYADYRALMDLAELSELDPSYLADVLSYPTLIDGTAENPGLTTSLLYLKRTSPALSHALESLPWIQDGISKPPTEGQPDRQSTTAYEHITVSALLELAGRSSELAISLINKQWMHEPSNYLKWRMVSQTSELASRNLETALQVAKMPFLNTLEDDDERALKMMNILGLVGSPRGMLSHEELVNLASDEDANEISGNVAKIILDTKHPEKAALINSYPWVQDGIDTSEFHAMRTLAKFVFDGTGLYYPDEIVWDLLQKSWVTDGLTKDEIRAVGSLQVLAHHEESNAISLLAMPFLESVDDSDASALFNFSALSSQRGTNYVKQVLSHPSLEGGITDRQAAIIADSYWKIHNNLEVLDELFDTEDP